MKEYVVGLMFSPNEEHVVLIRKKRPEWQAGRLNGPGGSVQEGEVPISAMVREFKEETGIQTTEIDWFHFCRLTCPKCSVHFFWTINVGFADAKTVTDEEVEIIRVPELYKAKLVYNLSWLIPMALNEDKLNATVELTPAF